MGTLNNGLFSSKDQTWETPQDLFDKLNKVFDFKLDVCAVPSTAKCEAFFTPEMDGLAQEWKGNCWMNPPYGREQVKWISKACDNFKGSDDIIACLIPARPDTKVWQDVIFKKSKAICFVRGRLKFGDSKSSAPFPSAIVLFGRELNELQRLCLESIGMLFEMK